MVIHRTGFNKLMHIFINAGPPEVPLKNLFGSLNARVTGELRRVGPLKKVRTQMNCNKEPVWGTSTGARPTLCGSLNLLLNFPLEGSNETGPGQD